MRSYCVLPLKSLGPNTTRQNDGYIYIYIECHNDNIIIVAAYIVINYNIIGTYIHNIMIYK